LLKVSILRDSKEMASLTLAPGEYLAGRAPDCDLLLPDGQVSEKHARLLVGAQGVRVEYLGMVGGFWVEGKKLTEADLLPGQAVTMGPFELRLDFIPEAETPPAVEAAPAPDEESAPRPQPGETTAVTSPAPPEDAVGQSTVVLDTQARPKARLVVREGDLGQKEYLLAAGKTLLGRAEECDLRIPHPSVSRRHAEIEMGPQGIVLRDLGSTSGTFVGPRQVKEALLKPGDSFRLGPVVLELAAGDAAAARQAAPMAEKKKPEKKKPEKKAKPPASPANRRRLLLYGVGAAALVFIAIALFSGGGEDKTKVVAQKAAQTQKQIETDQTQRLVVINLAHARKALTDKAYEKAVTHLQNVLSADPQNVEGRKLMDEAQKAIRQAEEEKQRAAQDKEKKSQETLALLTQAQEALSAKDYDRAKELSQQVLAVDPNQAQARYLIIKAQADKEQAAHREKFEQEEAAQRQAQAQKLLNQGKAQVKAKKTALAVQTFKKVLEVDPEGKTPYAGQAKEYLAKYLSVVRAQADKYVKAGQSDLGKGRLTKAVANFNQALRLDPANQKAAQGLADTRQKGAKLAKNLIQEGKVLDSLGKTQQACAKYRQAAPLLSPEDPAHAEVTAKIKACQ